MVNDGSTLELSTGRDAILGEFAEARWISYDKNHGKGHALREGVRASEGDYILYTDHDFPYQTLYLRNFLEILHIQHHQVVTGHRGPKYYQGLPWIRVKVSHYLKTINTFILGLNTDDTQCGLKAFHKDVKPIFLETRTDRFLIDIEFLRRLKNAGISNTVFDVESRDDVEMSTLGFKTILSELWAYAKIIYQTR